MNIKKRTDSFVEFVSSDGNVMRTLSENVTMNYYELSKSILISDQNGNSFLVKLNRVRTTQIDPNLPIVFSGSLSDLWDLLVLSFFDEKHISTGSTPIYGSEYNYIEDESESQTSQTTFITKAKLQVLSLPIGFYNIQAYAEFNTNRTNRSSYVELIRNVGTNDDIIGQTDQEPKDATNWMQFNVFKDLQLSGNQVFDIRFRSEQTNTTTRIRKARIKLFRVS